MAFNKKFTFILGQQKPDIAIANGTDISGGGNDAIEVNIDATEMTRGEAIRGLELVIQRIHEGDWPVA